jgi:phage-related protein (TIGR01555 family)
MNTPTKRGPGRPRKDAQTTDGAYLNLVSGLGSKRDPGSYTQAAAARLFTEGELEAMYTGDGFARRIIDVPAADMVRAGFEIENEADDDVYAPVMVRMEELQAAERYCEALKLAALYGGALVVLGVQDGGALDEPLNENAVKGVDFIRVYDRYRVSRLVKYADPMDRRYGQTEKYLVSPCLGSPYTVHETRCIVFQGEYIPDRLKELQDGWHASTLAKCWSQLQRYGVSHQWAEKLLERSQQAVNKMEGMAQQLMAPNGQKAVMDRLNILDMSRNILNTVAIDAKDDYTIHSAGMVGVSDVIDRFATALSAVTGMPKTLLLGEQSKGMGGGNDGDLQNWYAHIKQLQKTRLLAPIDRLTGLLVKALKLPEDYLIEFEPLHVPSEKEEADTAKVKADTEKVKADTMAAYISAGVLDPSEGRSTLIGQDVYKMDGSVTIETGEDDGQE